MRDPELIHGMDPGSPLEILASAGMTDSVLIRLRRTGMTNRKKFE